MLPYCFNDLIIIYIKQKIITKRMNFLNIRHSEKNSNYCLSLSYICLYKASLKYLLIGTRLNSPLICGIITKLFHFHQLLHFRNFSSVLYQLFLTLIFKTCKNCIFSPWLKFPIICFYFHHLIVFYVLFLNASLYRHS